ncbi:acetylglutamate synthase-like protein [Cucurbitaria berberidis CBS 394.84]|uniref:Amino-acid acetyltransferase, mitochondrial n=1 Tax=Cucurbitaria berberidis CBS 394.84 TaxID=1168544 RepID=A0A9P4L6N1_9PLEO|nr:acetylglutamate synthase-like protein [Cucurbitaria berberidis CBS 394.84]KAF1843532.1 acetylglutamate synthase-like protein [Cucurbitaria berberidis CBS 394.84]
MCVWSKAPAKGLGRATKKLPRFDSTRRVFANTSTAQLSTTARLDALFARKSLSSAKERQRAEREQLTRLLKESPGKRDARNFLKQFDSPKKAKTGATPKVQPATSDVVHNDYGSIRIGVNLGNLYQPTIFTRDPLPEEKYKEEEQDEPLHLALVKLRQPQTLDDRTLGNIAMTLSQMAQLGLSTAVVLDCDEDTGSYTSEVDSRYEHTVKEQAARLAAALEDYHEPGALLIEHALSYLDLGHDSPSTVEVQSSYLLYPPIDDGIIPIIPPFAYNTDLKKVKVQADDVLLALIREFAGITGQANGTRKLDGFVQDKNSTDFERPILDRIIILDPLGGIPSENRADGAHVFVNLEAEYRDIKNELQQLSSAGPGGASARSSSYVGSGNPFSRFVEEEIVSLPGSKPQLAESAPARHLKNLDVVQRALRLLPPSSSALILTPSEAGTRAIPEDTRSTPSKNPLLHNLLTDKPMVSSSLPTAPASRFLGSAAPNPSTFLKKGIPLTMIPDPRNSGPWQPPSTSRPSIDLANDPRINLPKLVHLINDSFRRKLDPNAYLERIHGRVAGIIIAGDYEGGAICTWEKPSILLNTTPTGITTPDSPYWVPYLDKFAVLTSSQGSGGVSDIVWAALTRTCFPEGVVWRSRTSNPVNKWYQERSKGMWNLPGGQWTMFWTTEGVTHGWDAPIEGFEGNKEISRWDAYVDVCSAIEPSWADVNKKAH